MIDLQDGDRLLNLVGLVLVLFIILGIVTLVLAATSVQQEASAVPDANWNLTRINKSYVRITHVGGEPIQTEKLSVTVDGIPRQTQWTSRTLTGGEYGIVAADNDSKVTLLWRESDVNRVVLKRWRLPQS